MSGPPPARIPTTGSVDWSGAARPDSATLPPTLSPWSSGELLALIMRLAAPGVSGDPATMVCGCSNGSSAGSMPITVTGCCETGGAPTTGRRYVWCSISGAATLTPGVVATIWLVAGLSPTSWNAVTRRSVRPRTVLTVWLIDWSMPVLVASVAKSTPTPRAMPATVRRLRSLLETKLRQASDERRGIVVLPSAQRNLFKDSAVLHDADAIGVGGSLRIVGDEHDRLVAIRARPPERVEDPGARRVVEVAGRLVGEQDRRPGHERSGDGDALLLARGQLIGPVTLLAAQVDERDDVADPRRDIAAAGIDAGDRERQADVFLDGQQRDRD